VLREELYATGDKGDIGMNEYLSTAELHSLTGYVQAIKQAAWLKDHGIHHMMVDNKRVIVSRVHVQARIEGRSATTNTVPNWAAVA
jgi:hypothetical protein